MTRFLKPAEGRTVDQLDGTPWPAEGMEADDSLFVRRRLRDGDLVKATPPAASAEPESETEQPGEPAKPATKPKGGK